MDILKILNPAFAKNAITLVGGLGISQIIFIFGIPMITRLYSPSEFGSFSVLLAISATLSSISSCRYELAIVASKTQTEAELATMLAFMLSATFSLFAVVILSLTFSFVGNPTRVSSAGGQALVVGVLTFVITAQRVLQYACVRSELFAVISKGKISYALLTVGIQATLGLAGAGVWGLLCGSLLGYSLIAGIFVASIRARRLGYSLARLGTARRFRKAIMGVARRHRKLPLFTTPASLASAAANELPVILIGARFGLDTAGSFSLCARALGAATTAIVQGVGQVFFKEFSREYRNERGEPQYVLTGTVTAMSLLGTVPFLVVAFFGEPVFRAVFSEAWGTAGQFAQIMALRYFARFVVAPTSTVFVICGRQELGLSWQLLLLVASVMPFGIAIEAGDVTDGIWLYSVFGTLAFLVSIAMALRVANVAGHHWSIGGRLSRRGG